MTISSPLKKRKSRIPRFILSSRAPGALSFAGPQKNIFQCELAYKSTYPKVSGYGLGRIPQKGFNAGFRPHYVWKFLVAGEFELLRNFISHGRISDDAIYGMDYVVMGCMDLQCSSRSSGFESRVAAQIMDYKDEAQCGLS